MKSKCNNSKNKNVKNREENKKDGKIESYSRRIIKNILNETLDISTWTVLFLFFIGKAASKIFLERPSYYINDPSEILGEVDLFMRKRIEKRSLQVAIGRLQRYGIVQKTDGEFKLTKIGNKLMARTLNYRNSLNEKWDGKYRVVVFDIPEVDRQHRNWLRGELYFLGYEQLQKSVFRDCFQTPDFCYFFQISPATCRP